MSKVWKSFLTTVALFIAFSIWVYFCLQYKWLILVTILVALFILAWMAIHKSW